MTDSRAEAVAHASLQGNYAGAVSRLAAFALDVVLSYLLFTLALAAVNFSASIVAGHSIHWSRSDSVVVLAISVVWEFLYFAYCWAATGKTPGMVVMGIRVVRADGAHAEPWRAVVRTLILPISVVLFFVSIPLILLQRAHQAPHDLVAGTAVVYAWDARAAKWRLLARDSARRQQATAERPEATAEQPQATAEQPEARAEQPQATAEQLEATAEQPEARAEQPQATAEQPEARAEQPQATAEQPQAPAAQPSATGDATPAAQPES